MSAPNRNRSTMNSTNSWWPPILLAGVIAVVCVVWGALKMGSSWAGLAQEVPSFPFDGVLYLFSGKLTWPVQSTLVLVGFVLIIAVLGWGYWRLSRPPSRAQVRVDSAASAMATRTDFEHMTENPVAAVATRLGVEEVIGLPIAKAIVSGQVLYSSWEDTGLAIWGPRQGKSTSQVIPRILTAPGPVLATSNKRDVLDATRDFRAMKFLSSQTWIFDPQELASEQPTWYWNPLSYVTDDEKALRLAQIWDTARDKDAKRDAYFDPAGQRLLSNFLLACALAKRPLTQVYLWTTSPADQEAARILKDHGYDLAAAAVIGAINKPDKERSGIFGSAQGLVGFLEVRKSLNWVCPNPGDGRPQFNPHDFVRSTDTLYMLSKEGVGSTGPIVTALMVAVTDAAEEYASTQAGGRLKVPLVCELDEAANICRLSTLPQQYSHYGSRGIQVDTYLQSWAQGVSVWGLEGMKALWAASTVKTYGGGVDDPEFLRMLSDLIGSDWVEQVSTSTSTSPHGRTSSTSTSWIKDPILEVSDLGSLPKGRVVVKAASTPVILARAIPWMSGPHAEAVTSSIIAHDPTATETLNEARAEMVEVEQAEAAWETQHNPDTSPTMTNLSSYPQGN